MDLFLRKILLFILLLTPIAFGVDYMISKGLRNTNIRKYSTWNDIYNKKLNSDLLVIGSSRAWSGYSTYILDSVLNLNSYNIGIDGHTLDFQILRYNKYLQFNKKPKIILLNIDFFSTFGEVSDYRYEREQFFPYQYLDYSLISQVSEVKNISFLERTIPLIRYFGYKSEIEKGISSFFGKKGFSDEGLYKGYRGNDYKWQYEKDTLKSINANLSNSDALENFIIETKKNDIKLIFVKAPFYFPVYNIVTNLDESNNLFESIAFKHDIIILDYYNSIISKDKNYFYNYTHLNKKGAEEFSKLLANDLYLILNNSKESRMIHNNLR